MRPRLFFPLVPFLIAAAPAFAGCGAAESLFGDGDDDCSKASASEPSLGPEPKEPGGIHGFSSEAELETYLVSTKPMSGAGGSKCNEPAAMNAGAPAASPAADSAGAAANENVTNNQEAGVDEGGIVKNIEDHLVVLRQGRLYAVDVADGKSPALSDSIRVARTDALNSHVWYDEMLVKGDLVYVVGYRYGVQAPGETGGVRGATEIDTFRLTNGKLTRLRSMFLESNDYYSGHNYASRMVGGKLVFYMPHYIGWRGNKLAYPRVLTADDNGAFSVVGPIFGALDVSTSLTKPHYPTFHTVVQCDLPDSGELACHGRSVIGSYWRETYVSPNAVYLWASSHVYRFDFESLHVSSHGATGVPVDQFSFREAQDKLLVAVNSHGKTELTREVGPALLSLPLSAFDKQGEQIAPSTLLRDKGFLSTNRFVGDVLVAHAGDTYASYNSLPSSDSAQEIVTLDTANGHIVRAPLGGVTRLEPLGDRRVLVVAYAPAGRGEPVGISLNAYSVDNVGAPLSQIVLPKVSQGERRSHGFFYRPDASGGGTIGYAVIAPPGTGATSGWGNGISNLGFFDVNPTGAMSTLGIISAGQVETECETSCVDWYGNTRPIFLRDRAFALMGSELAEIATRPQAKRVGQAVILSSNEAPLNQQ